MPEIDDNEYRGLLQAKQVLSELMLPKTADRAQALIKEHHPDYATDRDKAAPHGKELKEEIFKELEAREKKKRDDDLDRNFNDKINALKLSAANPNGYTEEGIEKIKQLMRDRTIPDPEAAAALFDRLNPQQPDAPSGYRPTGWNFGTAGKDDTDKKLLFEDPDAWADKEAKKVWDEVRKGQ